MDNALSDFELDIQSIITSEMALQGLKVSAQGQDSPRSRRPRAPLENATNRFPASELVYAQQDPVTPTSNFKLLTSLAASLDYAASPNQNNLIRKLDLSRKHCKTSRELEGSENVHPTGLDKSVASRKDKSLGRLCQKFLSSYPDTLLENQKVIISLDEVAKELGVERRRVYDIVNVLESIDVVTKVGKNTYSWHGRADLTFTLTKLMALAEEENLGMYLRALEEQLRQEEEEDILSCDEPLSVHDEESQSSACDNSPPESRKEKALAIISQKFLMLFLVSDTKIIHLDLAARAINGVHCDEGKKKRLKTRRLYDIANVLQSFGLIQKIFVTRFRGRKPAFRYTGPQLPFQVQSTNSTKCAISENGTPLTAEDSLKEISRTLSIKKSKLPRTRSGNLEEKKRGSVKRKVSSLVRHSSLKEICEIAERERKKFYPDEDQEACPNHFNSLQDLTGGSSSDSTATHSQPFEVPQNPDSEIKTQLKEPKGNVKNGRDSPATPIPTTPGLPFTLYQEIGLVTDAVNRTVKVEKQISGQIKSTTVYKPNLIHLTLSNATPKTDFLNSPAVQNGMTEGRMLVASPVQGNWTGVFGLTQAPQSQLPVFFVPSVNSQAAGTKPLVNVASTTHVKKVIIKKFIVKKIGVAK